MSNPTPADYTRLMQQVVALRASVKQSAEEQPVETWNRCPRGCGMIVRSDLSHFCYGESHKIALLQARVALLESRLNRQRNGPSR